MDQVDDNNQNNPPMIPGDTGGPYVLPTTPEPIEEINPLIPSSDWDTTEEENELQKNNKKVADFILEKYPKAVVPFNGEEGTAVFLGHNLRGVIDPDSKTAGIDPKEAKKVIGNLLKNLSDIAIVFSKEGITVSKMDQSNGNSIITLEDIWDMMQILRGNRNPSEKEGEYSVIVDSLDDGDIAFMGGINKPEGFYGKTLPDYLTTKSVGMYLKLVQAKEERREAEKKTPERIIKELL